MQFYLANVTVVKLFLCGSTKNLRNNMTVTMQLKGRAGNEETNVKADIVSCFKFTLLKVLSAMAPAFVMLFILYRIQMRKYSVLCVCQIK